jgi:hypothetical protein
MKLLSQSFNQGKILSPPPYAKTIEQALGAAKAILNVGGAAAGRNDAQA